MAKGDRIYYDDIAEYAETIFDLYAVIRTQKNRAEGLYPEQVSSSDIEYLKELEEAVESVIRLMDEIK
jgi:hypothetical protein